MSRQTRRIQKSYKAQYRIAIVKLWASQMSSIKINNEKLVILN